MAFHPVHPSYDPNSLTFFSLPCVFFPSLVTTFLIWLILQEHRSSRNLSSYFELHIFFLLFLFQIPKLPNIDPQLQKNAMAASSFMDRAPISELLGWPPPPSPPPSISHTVLSSPTLSTTPVRSMSPSPALLHQASRLSILWKNHLGAPPPV